MTRYQACRKLGLDPIASAFTTFIHWLFDAPQGYIAILHIVIEYDVDADPSEDMELERYE